MLMRIMTRIHPMRTGGAPVESPARLISGTAVPCLAPEMNTVARFDPTIFFSLASATLPTRRTPKRQRKASDNRAKFAMMPAYAACCGLPSGESNSLRAVNTPLARKAEEEMSELERDYPW
jgi:hypothetical protein